MNSKTTKYNVCLPLIQEAAKNNYIKPLALYHSIKSSWGNSVIFDYKTRMPELSKRFGVSKQTLYNYFEKLTIEGLIFTNPNNQANLHLFSIHTLKHQYGDKRKQKITITINDNLQSITYKLYAKIIENHIKRILFADELKKFQRGENRYNWGIGEISPVVSLSLRNLTKILFVNIRTVQKILIELEKLNIIRISKSKPQKITTEKLNLEALEDYPGYKFIGKNGTYIQFGNYINLVEYPAEKPNINIKLLKSIQSKKYNNHNWV